MARPKEKINTAFQQKCIAATDKLVQFQARTLKDDIERLYVDEVLTDVSVDVGSRKIPLHRCILKARNEDLYNYITSVPSRSGNNVSMVTKSHSTDVEQCLRSLYTDDDTSAALKKLDKFLYLEADQDLEQPRTVSANSDTRGLDSWRQEAGEDLHVISENITNTSLDLVKNEAISQDKKLSCSRHGGSGSEQSSRETVRTSICHVTGKGSCSSCDLREVPKNKDCNYRISGIESSSELDEQNIYRLAEKIVEQVIREAQNIVGCVEVVTLDEIVGHPDKSKEINKSVIENEGDVVVESGGDIEPKSSIINSCPVNSEKSSSVPCTADTPVDTRNNCRFTSSRKSSESIQRLLERVYGVKTLIRPCSQLGEDLLRMLLEQDCSDCVIQVQGDTYPAHRCVLAARSSYFAAMLGGYWRESEDEGIVLEGIDAAVLKQTLLYLYGGVIEVDPSCALGGLVMMADMYGMEGLKEVVAYNLNVQYCHFFHRPCPECIAGVPEALALTMIYNMDAMKEKCVRWINKNFGKVWASKSLATLPQEVLEFCISSAVKDLALNNVLDVMIDCQRLNEKTPRLKWTEPVFDMITQLMDAAIEFASQNFISLISGNTFRKIDKEGIAFNKQPLEDIFSMIIQALSPENACLAYLSLNKWIKTIEDQPDVEVSLFSEEFVDFVNILFKKCREHLCLYVHQVANTAQWELLSKDMQDNIMKEANYVCIDTNRGRMARPKLTSMQKKITATSPLSLKEYFECHFGQSKSPTRNLKSRKDQQQEIKKGAMPAKTKESSKMRRGKTVTKSADTKITHPVTLTMRTVKQVSENTGKSVNVSATEKKGSKGKSVPVSKDCSQNERNLKSVLESDANVNNASHSPTLDGNLSSFMERDHHSGDMYFDCDVTRAVRSQAANLELVDLAEGIQFLQEKPLPIFNVDFRVPK